MCFLCLGEQHGDSSTARDESRALGFHAQRSSATEWAATQDVTGISVFRIPGFQTEIKIKPANNLEDCLRAGLQDSSDQRRLSPEVNPLA